MRFSASIWLSIVVAFAVCAHADEPRERFARSELHMGVEFEVVLYASDAAAGATAISKAMARIAALDKTLSDYDLGSELSKLSESSVVSGKEQNGPFPSIPLSDDLWMVLNESQSLAQKSEGAFDVTIGPLTKLWRRARRWKELPEAEALANANASVGYKHLQLDPIKHTAQLRQPNMRLDLGGIAKGYAAEEAVKAVVKAGVPSVLVRASGDIVAADPPPGERGWRVGIAPLNPDEHPSRFVEIAHGAISTSGDARQHLIVNGHRYSHIIDPRTGECVAGRSSVTVIASRGSLADGIATAASVLGPDQALALCGKFDRVELLMVYENETGEQRTVESTGFKKLKIVKSK